VEISEITKIENLYRGQGGGPTLGTAYAELLARLEQGAEDRETSLRLMFLTWYACSEPGHLTGLPHDAWTPSRFENLLERLGGPATTNPEVMFVVSVMASSFPDCCGDETRWRAIGVDLAERYAALPAERKVDPATFEGRGAYGDYFAHIWRYNRDRTARASQGRPRGVRLATAFWKRSNRK
jgi:hypothetical protein